MEKIIADIEEKREELVQAYYGFTTQLNSEKMIRISKEFDNLIVKYMKCELEKRNG